MAIAKPIPSIEVEYWKIGNLQLVSEIQLAEREGFEPSVRLPVRSLSKGVLSTTQPPFLCAGREVSITGRGPRQPRVMDSSTNHLPLRPPARKQALPKGLEPLPAALR